MSIIAESYMTVFTPMPALLSGFQVEGAGE
jgi:hypothetical protein